MNDAQLKNKNRFVIHIYHELESQEQIDKALHNMESMGFFGVEAWNYDTLQEIIEKELTSVFARAYFFPDKDIEVVTKEQCEELADKCLKCFGDSCLVGIKKEGAIMLNDVFFKGLPYCDCGLVVYRQEGITFQYVKDVLEDNGAFSIILDQSTPKWMTIDFKIPSIMVDEFRSTCLKEIKMYSLYGDIADWIHAKKNLEIEWSRISSGAGIVKIKNEPYYDYSGEDLSLDPRFW